jgi:hypothetical protein
VGPILEDRVLRVAGLGHHVEITLGVEHAPETASDDGMVIDEEDPGRGCHSADDSRG